MSKSSFETSGYLFSGNTSFIEGLYEQYMQDPSSVLPEWRNYFNAMVGTGGERAHIRPELSYATVKQSNAAGMTGEAGVQQDALKVTMLVEAYRARGHMLTQLDPLNKEKLSTAEQCGLDLAAFGFTVQDKAREVPVGHMIAGKKTMKLEALVAHLTASYSRYIGAEIAHIDQVEERKWLAEKIEALPYETISAEQKIKTLHSLLEAEGLEQFLHVRFQGVKRFSIEGGENAITAVENLIDRSVAVANVQTIAFGMPHRGRLNMLTKVLGKPYHLMLWEFQSNPSHPASMNIAGDVKYHLGHSADRTTLSGQPVHLTMTPNPSHLEAVNPVLSGKVRAEQDYRGDTKREQVMAIGLHGDAAFAGQGVVMESLVLSELDGYTTGGTAHIVVNNQIGFTTSPVKARKSRYPTEVAKVVKAPIFHVNGDQAEEVLKVARLMAEYRAKFKKDVVMNLVCYRLYGHNEGDEPSFTQPQMYEAISKQATPATLYGAKLMQEGVVTQAQIDQKKSEFRSFLDAELEITKNFKPTEAEWCKGKWKNIVWSRTPQAKEEKTGVDIAVLKEVGQALVTVSSEVKPIRKLDRLFDAKREMITKGEGIDWATGEALAFGSLLLEGHGVRLSGQDCGRGTFSHRNSVILDEATEAKYIPLNNIRPKQAYYEVIDSSLSEYGVLGFEYGYSMTHPDRLVLWEGQFGDFSNGAQIIIDQFISSAETKWQRMSGLVMLLPHGMEGQGPEHSSARLERYLQLCAEDNMAVVNCSTPASYFHALRRQLKRNFRRPLIVMTPKSLLRHKLAVSSFEEMATGTEFLPIIGDRHPEVVPAKVTKIILCSGKIYYELLDYREKQKRFDHALVRMEQFYPYPEEALQAMLKLYPNASLVWCQEEPKNQGAWQFLALRLMNSLKTAGRKQLEPIYVGREDAASPAIGAYSRMHAEEQLKIVTTAIA